MSNLILRKEIISIEQWYDSSNLQKISISLPLFLHQTVDIFLALVFIDRGSLRPIQLMMCAYFSVISSHLPMTAKEKAFWTIVKTSQPKKIMPTLLKTLVIGHHQGLGVKLQITVSLLGRNAWGTPLRSCVNFEVDGLENIALTRMHHRCDLQLLQGLTPLYYYRFLHDLTSCAITSKAYKCLTDPWNCPTIVSETYYASKQITIW